MTVFLTTLGLIGAAEIRAKPSVTKRRIVVVGRALGIPRGHCRCCARNPRRHVADPSGEQVLRLRLRAIGSYPQRNIRIEDLHADDSVTVAALTALECSAHELV